jgi:type II secretory pathway pseudopilin PulG
MSIVLAIMGFMTGGLLTIFPAMINHEKHIETKKKLEVIRVAMESYMARNGRLPLPSNIKLAIDDGGYGEGGVDDNGGRLMSAIVKRTVTTEFPPDDGSREWAVAYYCRGMTNHGACVEGETNNLNNGIKKMNWEIGIFLDLNCRSCVENVACENSELRTTCLNYKINDVKLLKDTIRAALAGPKQVDVEADVAYVGSLPNYNLKLENKYSYDGWGNKFVYVVSENITDEVVGDEWDHGVDINGKYVYAVISAGKNQGYSYSYRGNSEPRHTSGQNIGLDDKKNSFNYMEGGVVVENNGDPKFDDIIIFETFENILRRSGLFNVQCRISIEAKGINCGESNLFFHNGLPLSLPYKNRFYSVEAKTIDEEIDGIKTRRLKRCVVECSEYGKVVVYPNYIEVGVVVE